MADEIEIAPGKGRAPALREDHGREEFGREDYGRARPLAEVMPETPSEPGASPVLERLHALVRRGYKAELGAAGNPDRIVLRHLGLAPDLVLHAGGEIVGLDARRPRYKRDIEPPAPIGGSADSDHLRFMRFLDTVPPVTFWHRNRPWRKKYLYLPAVLVAVWLICVFLTATLFGA
ncbi:MAG TPA: hypothetical protein VGA98_10255 [Allosphingosinicella sp.]|jgi:hypothetical protein